ncbi:MAG TPA: imelysin family protein [Bacteroidia bacterium]|jgi:predicted lipoprotein|nr:imelysin family protein [Bacteroidia bacterium]
MKTSIKFLLLASFVFVASSCNKDDDNATSTPTADYQPELKNISQLVITATYLNLNNEAGDLVSAVTNLKNNPTTVNLEAARQAWRETRLPWEQSEAFLFGPVEQQGIDPSIDSWPVNVTDLQNVLAGTGNLTKTYIDGLDGTLKGFHTIEFLLWGTNSNKLIGDFTNREFEYIIGCTESLQGATLQLYNAWQANGQNFEQILYDANSSNPYYPSQKASLQEVVNGMIAICNEVANGKLFEPFSQQDITLEESRFSVNSKQDFADNIRSVENLYLGTFNSGGNGKGISTIIASKNANLDAQVKAKITSSINAIMAIQGTFTSAITSDPQGVQNAIDEVTELQTLLQQNVLTTVINL